MDRPHTSQDLAKGDDVPTQGVGQGPPVHRLPGRVARVVRVVRPGGLDSDGWVVPGEGREEG